ncbi:type III secretion system export apparatus subunit SctS [Photobacterium chitinilyticum]|uniref:EscS/YscS/HrcS family type III secretion system export apparatus protein n=1 Tax=Photobacterium chitinilyticum TaxID=2485123 RepID=A0A3S3RG75_9GAMM|nr:type III secretion system export apparatus subunit SctS [Photobacterium chitinilyticum]RWX54484.1 EscS/YscS/HrcS family type III secretion system export apparatus protein [Photobacterium chitinilyticum]
MGQAELIAMTAQAIQLVLLLSLPPIVAAALVGTLVALLQALTQVQEQTLSFVIKLIAVIMVLFFTAHWLGGQLYQYSLHIFDSLPDVL